MGRWLLRAFALLVGAVLAGAVLWHATGPAAPDDALRVWTARKILTLDANASQATAVAVAAGRIESVGNLEEVERALGDRAFTIDRSFERQVLLPGFIDPHLHPDARRATILPIEIVSAMEWTTPRGRTRAVRGREAFLARLRELDPRSQATGDDRSMALGLGLPRALSRCALARDLDAISTDAPDHRLAALGARDVLQHAGPRGARHVEREAFDAHPQADWETGHLWERGALSLGEPMTRILASPAPLPDAASP